VGLQRLAFDSRDRATADLQFLGEYPSGIGRLAIVTGQGDEAATVWEIEAKTGAMEVHKLELVPGENLAAPSGVKPTEYRVIHPKEAKTFTLDLGRDYVFKVWSRSGDKSKVALLRFPR
jgi:hypothetical protein